MFKHIRGITFPYDGGFPGKRAIGHQCSDAINICLDCRNVQERAGVLQPPERGILGIGNKLIAVLSVMEAATTRIISLLTTDVKAQKFIAINREMMEEALNVLNIAAKVLACRWNDMWDILLASGRPGLHYMVCPCTSLKTIWGPIFLNMFCSRVMIIWKVLQ